MRTLTPTLGGLLAGLLAAVTAGCSGDTAASGALGPATAEGERGWPFTVEEVDRYDEPWAMAFLPGCPSISPGSLLVYDGEMFPDWRGDALIGALSGEALVRVDLDGSTAGEQQVFDLGERIRAVDEAPDGAIWLLEDEGAGRLLRLTPAA